MASLLETVRQAVHFDWDPIGISGQCPELGEYDTYVPGLCELLHRQVSEVELFRYLWIVETKSIGLQGNRERTTRFAHWLHGLDLDELT